MPKACKPYRAQTKGKVEHAVAYLKTNFLKRRLPETMEELNLEVLKWLEDVVHAKRNQTTQQSPAERFMEEQPFLLKWNAKPLYQIRQWELREVSKDCLISYKQNRYSVPFRYVGYRLKVHETNEGILEIYDEVHYDGLAGTKKEQEKNQIGLATPDSPTPLTNVEVRSLATYAALEEGD